MNRGQAVPERPFVHPATAGAMGDGELTRAAAVLGEASTVALACHINPDPDALGSMLGLAAFLTSRGKEVVCSWGNHPMDRPRWLGLVGADRWIVEATDFPKHPEIMVALDTAAQDRLGSLAEAAERAGTLILLDHHRTNPGFGAIAVVDPDASSTAEVVFRLVQRMGGDLPDVAAACLYAGVVTDTGRFQYEATSPETLRVAASLRMHRFDHVRLAQALFEEGSLGSLRVLALALARVEHRPEGNLVWTYVTQRDLSVAGVKPGEADELIDVIRTAREADVACVLRQQRDGRFKVSLRSKGATDVGSIAQAFGGGGHRLASGYTSKMGMEDTVQALVAQLKERLPAQQPETS